MSDPRLALPLPLELRLKIYLHLLRPATVQSLTLYHQEHKRSYNGLYPAILQVSKQTYREAVGVLSAENIFEINLSLAVGPSGPFAKYAPLWKPTYADFTSPLTPTGLAAYVPNFKTLLRNDGSEDQATAPYLGRPLSNIAPNGVIYPHCLRRLHHIELVTSYHAFWISSRRGTMPSNMSTMFLDVLACLSNEKVNPKTKVEKSLKVTMIADASGRVILARGNSKDERTKAEDAWTRNIILLLRRIQNIRNVVVLEETKRPFERDSEVREINIDTFDVPW